MFITFPNYFFFIVAISKSVLFQLNSATITSPPHIVFIVADDLGHNDVGFHGSAQIPTPNIDALAYSGLILNRYYTTPLCTPSRSALMTGKYPIHTGMQHGVLYGAEPAGLPLTEKLLPEYLAEIGYINHIVGKWHLGSWKKAYTPLCRGFSSHLGFWTGHQDYFDHTAVENPGWGLDMRRNLSIAYDLHGQYSTDIFTAESVRLIEEHDLSKPLFLYLAHTAVHSGNPYEPLRAPDEELKKFSYINDFSRQRFAAMLSKLDSSVGAVVKALNHRKMLNNSIIIFTSDNGGPAAGFNLNAASNYPLKGVKNTLWEGGIKAAGLIWSSLIEKPSRVANQFMHISDWLPTLLEAVSGELSNNNDTNNLDGVSLWKALSLNRDSPRYDLLHNIDDIYGNAAITKNNWKLIQGTTYNAQWDNWYGPSGRDFIYNVTLIQNSTAGQALRSINKLPNLEVIKTLRAEATVYCGNLTEIICDPLKAPCLFNIADDPCELQNVADRYPNILEFLQNTLHSYNETAVPSVSKPLDPRGNPKYWNNVFTNFGDYIKC